MRTLLNTLLFALAFLLALSGCTLEDVAPAPDTPPATASAEQADSDREAILALVQRRAQATQANDIATLDQLWSDDPVFVFEQGGVDSSWAAYRDHHLKPELDAFEDLEFRSEGVQVRLNGDMALATGRYVLKAHYEGRDIDSRGVFSTVLERQDGAWKIIHSHTSRRPSQ